METRMAMNQVISLICDVNIHIYTSVRMPWEVLAGKPPMVLTVRLECRSVAGAGMVPVRRGSSSVFDEINFVLKYLKTLFTRFQCSIPRFL